HRAEEPVAPGVVAVRVRVDDARDRLARDRLHAIDDRRAEAGQLGVHQRDPVVSDEHGHVTVGKVRVVGARARDDVEIVLNLLDLGRGDRTGRGALLVVALSVSWLSLSSASTYLAPPAGPQPLPPLMLWAWEQPTDLRSLD